MEQQAVGGRMPTLLTGSGLLVSEPVRIFPVGVSCCE